MYGVLRSWLIIVNLLLYSKCTDILQGVATFPSLTEQNVPLQLVFTQHVYSDQDQVTLKPSFKRNFEWKIHKLPVQMGHSTCATTTVGDCFKCQTAVNPNNVQNEPIPTQLTCLAGRFDLSDTSQIHPLPRCAKLSSQNGLIGRSVIVIEEDKSTSARSKTVHCATIFKSDFKDQFSGTIAWFQKPYAGFVAFRQVGGGFQSYILANMTRVTAWSSTVEKLHWSIEEDRLLLENEFPNDCVLNPSGKYDCVYNPLNRKMHSDAYSTECTNLNQFGCAQGDLTKKHNLIELDNTKSNLLLFIDQSLAVDELLNKQLVLYKLSDKGVRQVIFSTPIENIQPISVNVTFKDKSILRLMQRDPWSLVMYTYTPSSQGNEWWFTIHKVPTVHICSGELWNCHMWSNVALEPEDGFKASAEQKSLGQKYTLYGRDSIMYHGVIMKTKRGTVHHFCSTITYRQEDELIGYSKLENKIDQSGERAIAILIQHATFRQTTVLIASKCKDYSMPLYLSLSNDSNCRSTEVYNPHNVCPADCSASSCGSKCDTPCCTNCAAHSSSLCPMGDLRSRFGTFLQVSTNYRRGVNLELVWSVMNDLDLPLSDMINKKLGLKIAQTLDPDALMRCGSVRKLRQTQVKVQLAGGASLTLSQNATWQPLTVSWTLRGKVSLTFWKTPGFDKSVCQHTHEMLGTPHTSDEAGNTQSMTLPLDSTRKSFFGLYSILGCALSVEYTGSSGLIETTKVDLLPKGENEQTHNVQAVLRDLQDRPQIEFDLMQRADHLTEETYIKVTVLDPLLCNKNIMYKWYIIKNTTMIRPGDLFEVKDEKDNRFFGSDQVDCTYDTLKSGDLSGKLGDLKLDGAGHQYIDPYIPVKSVVGHFLLLTHPNNTVVASLLLQNAPKREDNPPVSASQHNNVSWIVGGAVLVAVALGFFACCCLYIHKRNICCGLKPSQQATQRYDPVNDPVKPIEPQYDGFYKIRLPDGSEKGPVRVIECENKYLSTMRVQHLCGKEEETVVLKFLVEMSKEEVENCNGYNTKATHIQTAGCIVSNGAQGYPREPRVVIKKPAAKGSGNHQYHHATENLYSKLPINGNTQDPVSYTDYRFRRTSHSMRSDSSLSGASNSS